MYFALQITKKMGGAFTPLKTKTISYRKMWPLANLIFFLILAVLTQWSKAQGIFDQLHWRALSRLCFKQKVCHQELSI